MRFFLHLTCFAFPVIFTLLPVGATAQEAGLQTEAGGAVSEPAGEQSLAERGRYISIASDCASCHTAREEGSKPFAGGFMFVMPMGRIVASNITPSKEFGIGNWSEADFARAVRRGVRPDGSRLYPAMPYTEYSTITDEDIKALYAHFMTDIAAVDEPLRKKTKLHFPFNFPGAMFVWNMLFLNHKSFEPNPQASAAVNRGRYLADGPAHCGTCHTPRNFMLASKNSLYLGGGNVGGWWAPNITSDNVGGLGSWSEEEIVTYLKTGNVRDKSQANGPMAEAVEYSFRHMRDEDLRAIAAYLKTVPPLPTQGQIMPAYIAHTPKNEDWTQYEFPLEGSAAPYSSAADTLNGAVLYNSACAACHGVNGQGADDGTSPSLLKNRVVGIVNPYSLIMTVAYGVERKGTNDELISMPGFLNVSNHIASAMNEEQIAAVVNYVRNNFGEIEEQISADDVKTTLKGGEIPFVIRYALPLAICGFIVGGLFLLWLLRRFIRGRHHGSRRRIRKHRLFGFGHKGGGHHGKHSRSHHTHAAPGRNHKHGRHKNK